MIDSSLIVVHDPAELAARAADEFIAISTAAIAARGRAVVALAGGSTPRAMNALLAAAPWRERIDWSKVAWYFGDERCVPPDHPDSNYRMTRETLFGPLGISDASIYRVRGEDDPQLAADAYDALLRETLGTPPIFDVINLGMGPDGHTASLFPGTLGGIDDTRCAVANFIPKFDTYRITITPHVIRAARHVVITAAGAEKADALRDVLSGAPDPDRFPAQIAAPPADRRRWFVDAAAAAKLPLA